MTLSITTWNINSVRLRENIVLDFLNQEKPDILCLQETKCPDDAFPSKNFRAAGYEHMAISGQKGYHGVAILSRLPLSNMKTRLFCTIDDRRYVSVVFETGSKKIRLHNFYVPAGGDEPDPEINPKFAHKLAFLEEMLAIRADENDGISSILVGDLNIAPLENDVWSHKQLLKIVSHTPIEVEGLNKVLHQGAWVDLMREIIPPEDKLYTWWSYRAKDWQAANRGRRLDHIWGSKDLVSHLKAIDIKIEARGWEKPSDHVPVTARFDI
ncbi:exodeoxyribonuclease III [Bartonella sp. HY329]|uniref:exodeoxyribonuclease III n=1 Tax=unclassified Bartonella TaxID=2645622 RepID=UPI0021C65C27|nr:MULTISPECIES: exodeoxyribonuclease III [unclassified Bartonella]UXM95170.1 exodeoxyribonuclease III [Bartonella sp. HY329]UXN09493.1 exodeoxyribonuclease III [Bartonella sp. HY328]